MIQNKFCNMSEYRLFLRCQFWKASLLLLCLFFHGVGNAVASCKPPSPFVSNLRDIACATSDLRTAVQKDDLLKKMSDINFFSSKSPLDVLRSVETLSFFDRSLTDKIKETHQSYQKSEVDSYTLSITSYPSDVEADSCSKHKTISFDSIDSDSEFPNYSVVPGKEPRSFQMGIYKGRSVICERTRTPYKKRLRAFCGKPVTQCNIIGRSEDCNAKNEYTNVKEVCFIPALVLQ